MSAPVARVRLLAAAALLGGLGGLLAAPASADKIKEDEGLNYEFHVPDNWEWKDPSQFAEKFAVKAMAERKLEKLADRKTDAQGEGARAMLSVQDVPASLDPDFETWLREWQMLTVQIAEIQGREQEVPKETADKQSALLAKIEAALAGLAGKEDVYDLLMSRFGDKANWPKPDVDARNIIISTIPAAKVDAVGTANNLAATAAKFDGRMWVWVLRKKMYRLVVWVWPTERDREGLKTDRDLIEFNFVIPKKEAIPRKPVEMTGPKASDPSEPGAEAPRGDEGERKIVDDKAYGFKVIKPVKFTSEPPDRAKNPESGFQFRAYNAVRDEVIVDLLVYRLEGSIAPFKVDAHFEGVFAQYLKDHPTGAIETWPFPGLGPKAPFISLPDPKKKKEVKRPDEKDKVTRGRMEDMGVLADVKGATVSKEKARFAWRFCISGTMDRVGKDTWIQYVFSTSARTYLLRVVARKEGLAVYKPELDEILSSFQMQD